MATPAEAGCGGCSHVRAAIPGLHQFNIVSRYQHQTVVCPEHRTMLLQLLHGNHARRVDAHGCAHVQKEVARLSCWSLLYGLRGMLLLHLLHLDLL
jgi:hypothetical protein